MALPVLQTAPVRNSFATTLERNRLAPLRRGQTSTIQINVGKRCNQACHHCHVDAGPKRTEVMAQAVVERILQLIDRTHGIDTVDITGGAPELNPHFRDLIAALHQRKFHIIDRCNLTVLFEPNMADLSQFLADHQVHVIASLPCYSANNVDKQRGHGVFEKSIAALQKLNALGYGKLGSNLYIDLVYNPLGASLPPAQHQLETKYKRELSANFGITFNQLLTITNLPIRRFARQLERNGEYNSYLDLLTQNFNADTVPSVMCRSLVNIGYDGKIYDCDFNQMLDLAMPNSDGNPASKTVWDLSSFDDLNDKLIATGSHCLGCTAGAGSSCSGALS